jgi:hypothetical protein
VRGERIQKREKFSLAKDDSLRVYVYIYHLGSIRILSARKVSLWLLVVDFALQDMSKNHAFMIKFEEIVYCRAIPIIN